MPEMFEYRLRLHSTDQMIVEPQAQVFEAGVSNWRIECKAHADMPLALRLLKFTGQWNTIERKLVGREFLPIGDEDDSPLFRIQGASNIGNAVSQTSTLAIRAEPLKTLQSFSGRTELESYWQMRSALRA